jgi:sec-independent protein translocase protein TatA
MDFFGIGPWEILLILVIALIVVGPGKLPGIARTLGKTVRAIRKASSELTTAVTREMEAAEKSEKSTTALKKPDSRTPEDSPTKPGEAPPSP